LRAGAGALGDVVFFAAGFIVVLGFVVEAFFFAAGSFLATAFFFAGTADLLSFRGYRGRRVNLTARARIPQTAGPDESVTVAVCWPC
jgi:hypothetical protein